MRLTWFQMILKKGKISVLICFVILLVDGLHSQDWKHFYRIQKCDKLPSNQSWKCHLLVYVPQLQFEDNINYREICTNVFCELATP